MKVQIMKDFGILTVMTNITVEVFEAIKQHAPEALQLCNTEKEPVYAIDFDPTIPKTSITENGMFFNKVSTEGFIGLFVEEKGTKAEIASKYSVALNRLRIIENNIEKVYKAVKADLDKTAETIEEVPPTAVVEEIKEGE